MKNLRLLVFAMMGIMAFASCTKEDLEIIPENPIDLELSSQWIDSSVDETNAEIWFRVAIPEDVNQVIVEWSERDYHGNSRDYQGNIVVDAYWLNGETAYFSEMDNGYGEEAHLIDVSTDAGLLIRVRMKNDEAGTFGLKVYEKESSEDIVLQEIQINDPWLDLSIQTGETLGFLVKGGVANQNIVIQWAEYDSPESGYSADIKGSVFMLDQETAYKIASNGKNYIGKDSSHSDNPKSIILDQGENEFVVIISLNDPSKPGSFALQIK